MKTLVTCMTPPTESRTATSWCTCKFGARTSCWKKSSRRRASKGSSLTKQRSTETKLPMSKKDALKMTCANSWKCKCRTWCKLKSLRPHPPHVSHLVNPAIKVGGVVSVLQTYMTWSQLGSRARKSSLVLRFQKRRLTRIRRSTRRLSRILTKEICFIDDDYY